MRDFSKVGPRVWKSRKFWKLPDDATRLAYLYCITSQHVNSAGCYDLSTMTGAGDLKWSEEDFRYRIEKVAEVGLIEWDRDESTIRITNWFTFNEPNNPKHAMGILAQLSFASSDRLRLNQINDLHPVLVEKGFLRDKPLQNALRTVLERLPKPYSDGNPTETETETQTEKETKNEIEIEKKTEKIRTENARDGDPDAAPDGASVSPPRAVKPPMQMPASAERVEALLDTPLMRRTAK